MEHITSRQNPLLQQIKKLQASRSLRYREKRFVADGTKLLGEAVRWCDGLEAVVLQDGVNAAVPKGVRCVTVPRELMQSLSSMEAPQGALFVCKMPECGRYRFRAAALSWMESRIPGNLGTILRTADAMDIPVALTDGCADPYGEKTVRASMGAVFPLSAAAGLPEGCAGLLPQFRYSFSGHGSFRGRVRYSQGTAAGSSSCNRK